MCFSLPHQYCQTAGSAHGKRSAQSTNFKFLLSKGYYCQWYNYLENWTAEWTYTIYNVGPKMSSHSGDYDLYILLIDIYSVNVQLSGIDKGS